MIELDGPAKLTSVPTGPDGKTEIAGVDPTQDYKVKATNDDLNDWIPHTPRVGPAALVDGVLDVVLHPPNLSRLVTARVTVGTSAGMPSKLTGNTVKTTGAGGTKKPKIFPDGMIYALGSPGGTTVEFEFTQIRKAGQIFAPPVSHARVLVPRNNDTSVYTPVFCYTATNTTIAPWYGISVEPKIKDPSGNEVALTGALVTLVALGPVNGSAPPAPVSAGLAAGETEVRFANLNPALYKITVDAPSQWQGWPLKAATHETKPYYLSPGEQRKEEYTFEFTTAEISGTIQAPGGKSLDQDVCFEIFGSDGLSTVIGGTKPFTALVPSRVPLKVRLAHGSKPTVKGIPLVMDPPEQLITSPSQGIAVSLQYEHGITGQAVDEQDNGLPGAVIIAYDETRPGKVAGRAVAGTGGYFTVGVKAPGTYGVAFETKDGQLVTLTSVSVNSIYPMGKLIYRPLGSAATQADGSSSSPGGMGTASPMAAQASTSPQVGGPGQNGTGGGSFALPREAFTDLASYPVLTEEITTTGVPAPVSGGTAGTGAGYGPAVDQVIRDVLGWRPRGDVAGFQAALNGAFQLKEVQGHTEWTWQQRGYAVQADMGALTGAQASIYARAKSALDQITPLLTGLTAINPALYPPQDLEAIRTIVSTELNELVTELALEGGPRIQRVDELFSLLLGSHRSRNPDQVNGQLGQLRDRFGLTVDQVNTLDEERMITNFRVIVDQVMSLETSWQTDRRLFSRESIARPDSRTSFGTVLVWLSRSLEAVSESVDDLTFAMDSVFVDAAQRQVIELRFDHLGPAMAMAPTSGPQPPAEPPILLSDLLDWVTRASRDEGPRIIQDAGKDGVTAFAPVLERLRFLVHATRDMVRDHHGLPPGLRTPRVKRAFDVLADQLREAAELAASVRRQKPPVISAAWVESQSAPADGNFFDQVATAGSTLGSGTAVIIRLLGSGFQANASVLLALDGRPDLPEQEARVTTIQPSMVQVSFTVPPQLHHASRATWLVSVANRDGTHSNEVPVDIDLSPVSGRASTR